MTKFTKDGIVFIVEDAADRWGNQHVTAEYNGQITTGQVPGTDERAYPRIEFMFSEVTPWLRARARGKGWHQGWIVGDHETEEETSQRPTDSITLDLDQAITDALTAARIANMVSQPQKQPIPTVPREYIEPIFAIGGLNLGDGAEIQTPIPTGNRGCRWKSGTRYEENCEACGRFAFEICNNCGCCEKCHGR